MRKEWRVCERNPNYHVYFDGRVWSVRRKKFRKSQVGTHGYLKINIGGEVVCVHILVLEAFHGPRPKGKEACHYDDDKLNNNASNLFWGTHTQNMADMKRNGNGTAGVHNGMAKLDEDAVVDIRENPAASLKEMAAKYGVSVPTVCMAKSGATWRHIQ